MANNIQPTYSSPDVAMSSSGLPSVSYSTQALPGTGLPLTPDPVSVPNITAAPRGNGSSSLPPAQVYTMGQQPVVPQNSYGLPEDIWNSLNQDQRFQSLLQQMNQAHDDTNAANEARYQEILGGYKGSEQAYADREARLMGMLQGYGDTERANLDRTYEQKKAGLTQEMINRGMYDTTAALGQQRGLDYDANMARMQMEDALRKQQMEFGARLSGETLSQPEKRFQFMERKNEVGPGMADVAGLAQVWGESQANQPSYLDAFNTVRAGGGTQPTVNTNTNTNTNTNPIGAVPTNGLPQGYIPRVGMAINTRSGSPLAKTAMGWVPTSSGVYGVPQMGQR